jgi:hypothetical protein
MRRARTHAQMCWQTSLPRGYRPACLEAPTTTWQMCPRAQTCHLNTHQKWEYMHIYIYTHTHTHVYVIIYNMTDVPMRQEEKRAYRYRKCVYMTHISEPTWVHGGAWRAFQDSELRAQTQTQNVPEQLSCTYLFRHICTSLCTYKFSKTYKSSLELRHADSRSYLHVQAPANKVQSRQTDRQLDRKTYLLASLQKRTSRSIPRTYVKISVLIVRVNSPASRQNHM